MLRQEEREKIIELLREGKPKAHIAEELDISRGTIDNIQKESGNMESKQPEDKASASPKITDNFDKLITSLAFHEGVSPEEFLSLLLDMYKICYENGIYYRDIVSYIKSRVVMIETFCPKCSCNIVILTSEKEIESIHGDIPVRCANGHEGSLDKTRVLEFYKKKIKLFEELVDKFIKLRLSEIPKPK